VKSFFKNLLAWVTNEEPRKTNLVLSMVPLGGASLWQDVSHPFTIKRGRRALKLQVDEAEWLVSALTEMLQRPDVRRPIKIEVKVKTPQG